MVSLGFVLLIRAANVVNFAQGEFSMLGAYAMVVLFNDIGVPYVLADPCGDPDGRIRRGVRRASPTGRCATAGRCR